MNIPGIASIGAVELLCDFSVPFERRRINVYNAEVLFTVQVHKFKVWTQTLGIRVRYITHRSLDFDNWTIPYVVAKGAPFLAFLNVMLVTIFVFWSRVE